MLSYSLLYEHFNKQKQSKSNLKFKLNSIKLTFVLNVQPNRQLHGFNNCVPRFETKILKLKTKLKNT